MSKIRGLSARHGLLRTAVTVSTALALGAVVAAGAAGAAVSRVQGDSALVEPLRTDLSQYLASRGPVDHISAVSLTVTYPGGRPGIEASVGTTRYAGGTPVSSNALWQIGSNTKAFTAVMLLQLEAEGALSIHDTLGEWLPQYPQWRDVTIEQLLDMTSGIADYGSQEAFADTLTSRPDTVFSEARLVAYVTDLRLSGHAYAYSNTNYILAQMVIERATRDTYSDQLTKRILKPLGLHDTCLAPYTCPAATAARMPAGYFGQSGAPAFLDKQVPPLALTWAQGAGGIVSSLQDMTTWDRALYAGRELPAAQQRELESLVSTATGRPIDTTTPTDPQGYGLGVVQETLGIGTVWAYEGGTLGYRVLHLYFPRTGLILAIAVNSSADADTLPGLAESVYQILKENGAAGASR
jgi:D-alanyl-D-alanine carboxypeptidase